MKLSELRQIIREELRLIEDRPVSSIRAEPKGKAHSGKKRGSYWEAHPKDRPYGETRYKFGAKNLSGVIRYFRNKQGALNWAKGSGGQNAIWHSFPAKTEGILKESRGNPFALYDDMPDFMEATEELRKAIKAAAHVIKKDERNRPTEDSASRAADIIMRVAKKWRKLGATDTESMEAISSILEKATGAKPNSIGRIDWL